jgi:hypothetical protein
VLKPQAAPPGGGAESDDSSPASHMIQAGNGQATQTKLCDGLENDSLGKLTHKIWNKSGLA